MEKIIMENGISEINVDNLLYLIFDFKQTKEDLEGEINLEIKGYQKFYKFEYSIYRKGLELDGNSFDDYVINKKTLPENHKITIYPPYYGRYNFILYVYEKEIDSDPTYVIIKKGIDFYASHYNIVYSNSTLPVLYATFELFKLDHNFPTYLILHRSSIYDWSKLPRNTYPMPTTKLKNKTIGTGLFDDNGIEKTLECSSISYGLWGQIYENSSKVTVALKQLKYWIGELYNINNKSTFTFIIDDIISNVGIWFSYGNNIPEKNFNILMFTEGCASLKTIINSKLTTYKNYITAIADFENYISLLKQGLEIDKIWASKYSIPLASKKNVKYFVNIKSAFLNCVDLYDENYKKYLITLNSIINQRTINDCLIEIENAGLINKFEFLIKTRWHDNFNNIVTYNSFFNSNGKKNLLILDVEAKKENNSNSCGLNTTLMSFIDEIITKFGDEYNLFYKGHPASPIHVFKDNRIEYFKKHNITVLPNSISTEIFMFLFKNVYIGGYYTATLINCHSNQCIFLIGKKEIIEKNDATHFMFDKNSKDYKGIFENTKYLSK